MTLPWTVSGLISLVSQYRLMLVLNLPGVTLGGVLPVSTAEGTLTHTKRWQLKQHVLCLCCEVPISCGRSRYSISGKLWWSYVLCCSYVQSLFRRILAKVQSLLLVSAARFIVWVAALGSD
ncbi:MAG: hypothetical protein PUP93_25560 [Rhizonema sp. NSF051]|nr:hypothetical protein [Rhizonema sp. NSF051]